MSTPSGAPAVELEVGLAAPDPGPRVLAPFGRRRCRVGVNEAIGRYQLIGAEDPDGPAPLPGQFYMLAAAEGWSGGADQRPYLARAFSVCQSLGERRDFLVDDIGPGTNRLARLVPGEDVWLVGPLGIGFSAPRALIASSGESMAVTDSPVVILVGGGIGIAPLVIWKEALVEAGTAPLTLLGFRNQDYAGAAKLLGGEVTLATDDGSAGRHGLVTALLEEELERPGEQVVYACGPPRMLETVRRLCSEHSTPAELAMEEAMACGFGACYGCVIKTRTGYRRLCVDGPVVRTTDLDESWHR
jgi:dihydroorotate dehydrogenase electron transfer subunit